MVNNSTNINKVNNHLSPKENFKSDGQQFHQYQQNVQPPLTSKQLNIKKRRCMVLQLQVLVWNRHKNVKTVCRIPTFPSDIGSLTQQCRYKQIWNVSMNSVLFYLPRLLFSCERVSDFCLMPFQLYHGRSKLIFNEIMMRSALC